MKKQIAALLLLVVCSTSAFAQRTLNERRAIVPDGFVRIFIASGNITVIGWDKDSLVVTGTVYEPPGDRFGIGVTPKGAKMGLWGELEQGVKPSRLTVMLPRKSQLWVKTVDGEVNVKDVMGGLDLFSVSGSFRIEGAPSEIYAETMGGQIIVNANTASARLKTAAGAIKVSGTIADLTAVTVSGPIEVTKSQFKRARVESVDGDIRFLGALAMSSVLDVTNHSGAIDLFVPVKTQTEFTLSQYSGEFTDEFGFARKYSGARTKAKDYTFALGKPLSKVTLRSFKGRISIRQLR